MNRRLATLLAACAAAAVVVTTHAQPAGQAREFRFPLFKDNKQTGLLTGTGARTQADGIVRLDAARVEHFDAGGNTNASLLILATNCAVDLKRSRVSSPDGLRVSTADGQLTLTGSGFLWTQEDSDLVVSNQVRTVVRKNLAEAAATGEVLTVEARVLRFNHVSNVVVFREDVQVSDPEISVSCRELAVRRSAGGKFDRLLAEQDVVIVSHRDGSRATSDRAEYRLIDGGEVVELTGAPRWTDTEREARADRFVLERGPRGSARTLRALGDALLRLPADTNRLASWSLLEPAAPAAGTNSSAAFIELAAGGLTLALPPTNGPVRSILAETNVVIRDAGGLWQASAALAVLTNEVLELTGDPRWSGRGREVRGERLRLHTGERAIDVEGGAWLKLPVDAFTARMPGLGPTNAPTAPHGSNLVVIVESAAASFREGRLRFAPPVTARLADDTRTLGELHCHDLEVAHGQRLESIEASGEVRLEQHAAPAGRLLARSLDCGRLRVTFDPRGFLETVTATGRLRASQSEVRRAGSPPLQTTLAAESLAARFVAGTNRVESATATGGVRVTRGDRRAEGGEAEFTGRTGELVLSGDPVVVTPEGRISDATSLTWDTRANRARGVGAFRIEWTRMPTNAPTQLFPRPAAGGSR